jgi:methyltransferase (TIGR00027 family)
MSSTLQIESMTDIALGMAIGRAIETERLDAHFRDPYARLLGGERGEQFLKSMGGLPNGAGLAVAIRTCIMDEMILWALEQGVDTVLNLAAGFDTRPYRMALPAHLNWIEVDLPDVLDYKQEKLAGVQPVCAVETIRLNLMNEFERDPLLDRVDTIAQQALVITEGLLAYLTSDQVINLATALHQRFHINWWLTELASPFLLNAAKQTWGEQLDAANAALHFAPEAGPDFFYPYGWQTQEFRLNLQEAHRLNRDVPFGWLLRKLPIFKDGVVLLKADRNHSAKVQ